MVKSQMLSLQIIVLHVAQSPEQNEVPTRVYPLSLSAAAWCSTDCEPS